MQPTTNTSEVPILIFGGLFGNRRKRADTAAAVYGAIVAQSRTPALYADLGVPDTTSGRFEMVVLHAFLVLRRMFAGGTQEKAAGQAVFDLFCIDMDRSLRELGVGDIGIPKRMREVGKAFYGRSRAYEDCVTRDDEPGLAAALRRNVLKDGSDDAAARPLARYVLASARRLGEADPSSLAIPPLPFLAAAGFALALGTAEVPV